MTADWHATQDIILGSALKAAEHTILKQLGTQLTTTSSQAADWNATQHIIIGPAWNAVEQLNITLRTLT